MEIFTRIEKCWGFLLPAEYKKLSMMGALDDESPNHLRLSAIWWLDASQIECQELPDNWLPRLVPFARSPKGDKLCWVLDWVDGQGICTAFCLRGSKFATGYAPSFAGAVYRAVIEEFMGSVLGDSAATLQSIFRSYTERLAPIFPEAWTRTLYTLADRQPRFGDDGGYVLDENEANELIEVNVGFPRLGERFRYIR